MNRPIPTGTIAPLPETSCEDESLMTVYYLSPQTGKFVEVSYLYAEPTGTSYHAGLNCPSYSIPYFYRIEHFAFPLEYSLLSPEELLLITGILPRDI